MPSDRAIDIPRKSIHVSCIDGLDDRVQRISVTIVTKAAGGIVTATFPDITDVSGLVTITADVDITGDVDINGATALNGDVDVGGQLNVQAGAAGSPGAIINASNAANTSATLELSHARAMSPVLNATGAEQHNHVQIGAPYTTDGSETIIGITGGTPLNITLTDPDASSNGVMLWFKDEGNVVTGINTVSVTPTGLTTAIDGATGATVLLNTGRGKALLYWDGANWQRLI